MHIEKGEHWIGDFFTHRNRGEHDIHFIEESPVFPISEISKWNIIEAVINHFPITFYGIVKYGSGKNMIISGVYEYWTIKDYTENKFKFTIPEVPSEFKDKYFDELRGIDSNKIAHRNIHTYSLYGLWTYNDIEKEENMIRKYINFYTDMDNDTINKVKEKIFEGRFSTK